MGRQGWLATTAKSGDDIQMRCQCNAVMHALPFKSLFTIIKQSRHLYNILNLAYSNHNQSFQKGNQCRLWIPRESRSIKIDDQQQQNKKEKKPNHFIV